MKKILEKQGWHLAALVILLTAAFLAIMRQDFRAGQLWGISTPTWYWIAILIPIIHQVIVALAWRAQFHYGWMTRVFGKQDFLVYTIFFMFLFFGRPISILLLGISNNGSLGLSWLWRIVLGVVLFVPFVYLIYSVAKYFGFKRALGADHFYESYRELPMVKEGIYKYTSNGMYLFGFLILWVIALLTGSLAALAAAAFNHLYIWVHYYTTEKPDMQHIYGNQG